MRTICKNLSSLFLGVALISLVSPLVLYWFIYGDAEKYSWIINRPAPFSNFGSAPYQLWMRIELVFVGVVMVVLAVIFRELGTKFEK